MLTIVKQTGLDIRQGILGLRLVKKGDVPATSTFRTRARLRAEDRYMFVGPLRWSRKNPDLYTVSYRVPGKVMPTLLIHAHKQCFILGTRITNNLLLIG